MDELHLQQYVVHIYTYQSAAAFFFSSDTFTSTELDTPFWKQVELTMLTMR